MDRSVTAKGQHDQIARVASTLGGDGAQRTRHRCIGDPMHSPGGLVDPESERTGDMSLQRGDRELAPDR